MDQPITLDQVKRYLEELAGEHDCAYFQLSDSGTVSIHVGLSYGEMMTLEQFTEQIREHEDIH